MTVRRRRECIRCGFRFSTLEEMELLDVTIIKRNGNKEPYSREKLSQGLKKALEKRPVSEEEFKKLLNSVERDLQKKRRREIKSSDIGEIVMRRLKNFDKIAYIRFASVYRSFEDVETFEKELQGLLTTRNKRTKRRKK